MFLDFVFMLVFVLSVLLGYRKGFSQMLISCLVFLFSIFIVWGIANYLGDSLVNSEFGKGILEKAASGIVKTIESSEQALLQDLPINIGVSSDNINEASMHLAKNALKALMTIPLVVISFLIFSFCVKFIRKLAKKTMRIPVVGHLDSLLGALFGFLSGIVLVGFVYFIMVQIQFLPSMEVLKLQIESSNVVIFISDVLG